MVVTVLGRSVRYVLNAVLVPRKQSSHGVSIEVTILEIWW